MRDEGAGLEKLLANFEEDNERLTHLLRSDEEVAKLLEKLFAELDEDELLLT